MICCSNKKYENNDTLKIQTSCRSINIHSTKHSSSISRFFRLMVVYICLYVFGLFDCGYVKGKYFISFNRVDGEPLDQPNFIAYEKKYEQEVKLFVCVKMNFYSDRDHLQINTEELFFNSQYKLDKNSRHFNGVTVLFVKALYIYIYRP